MVNDSSKFANADKVINSLVISHGCHIIDTIRMIKRVHLIISILATVTSLGYIIYLIITGTPHEVIFGIHLVILFGCLICYIITKHIKSTIQKYLQHSINILERYIKLNDMQVDKDIIDTYTKSIEIFDILMQL